MPKTETPCLKCSGSGAISMGNQRTMRNGSWVSEGRFTCDCGEARKVLMFIQKN